MDGCDIVGRMKRLLGSIFGGRHSDPERAYQRGTDGVGSHDRPQLHRIDFEMMLKGSIYQRRRGPIRQYGVTVNGSTRLVTSGDMVDEETFLALIAAGAINAPQAPPPKLNKPSVVDLTEVEGDGT